MARHVVSTHAQLHGGTSCAIGCPRSSCRTPSKSVRPRRMAPCEGGRRRRSSGGLSAAFARRSGRQWRDTWCQRMHNCTEAHPRPSVALEAPVELPPRASALAAWHRAKAGGAVDRAEGCRRPSRGEVGANGATRGVNACTAARRHILRHRLPSKLLSNSLQERPPSPHRTVRRRAAPSIERRAAGGEEKCAPMARHVVSTHEQLHGGTFCAIGCPRSSCRTPSKSVRPRRMAPCEGGRRRRSSGGLPAAFARRTARQWRDTWCQRMNSCTEAHSAPSVALEAPVELPPRASALAAWHRAKAGGAVDRAEGCRRPSRGELRANGATRGVNA